MAISDEMRVDMVKLFYANGSSWTNARRALQHKYGDKARKIHLKTINTHNARIWSDKQPYATHEGLKTRENW